MGLASRVLMANVRGRVLGWHCPVHLIFHVTSRCNARCGMCFAWQRLNQEEDLSLAEIKRLSHSLPNLIFLDLSGGEPFLRADLAQILAVFEKDSPEAYVNLPTNGLLPEKIESITKKIMVQTRLPVSLNLSLDGLAKKHDAIRGCEGGFEKLMEAYRRLARVKRDWPRLSLKAVTVVSNQNFSQLEALTTWVKEKMPAIDFHALTLIRGEPRQSKFCLPPLEVLQQKQPFFEKVWAGYGYGRNLSGLTSCLANEAHDYLFGLYLKTLATKKMPQPCRAGQTQAVVYANGEVALCELLKPIGNLREVDFDFDRLWRGIKARRQRTQISQKKCFCTHGCVWVDNLLFNPVNYLALGSRLGRRFFARIKKDEKTAPC